MTKLIRAFAFAAPLLLSIPLAAQEQTRTVPLERAIAVCRSFAPAPVDLVHRALTERFQLKYSKTYSWRTLNSDPLMVCMLQYGLNKREFLADGYELGKIDSNTFIALRSTACLFNDEPFEQRHLERVIATVREPGPGCTDSNQFTKANRATMQTASADDAVAAVEETNGGSADDSAQYSDDDQQALSAMARQTETETEAPEAVTEPEREEVQPEPAAAASSGGGKAVAKPAGAKCPSLASVNDPDVRRNAARIRQAGLRYCEIRFADPGFSGTLQVIDNPQRPNGPRWAVPHDNEHSAFDTGVRMVAEYGGRMVAVEAGERRILARQDPNRAFAYKKRRSCRFQRQAAKDFTQKMIAQLSGYPVWFALHTNSNGHAGNGGSGHISAARSSAVLTGRRSPSAKGALADPDNAIMLAGSQSPSAPAVQAWISRIHDQGINVIYERVSPQRNDCSLSNFLIAHGKAGLGTYFNIEAEHGQTAAQIQMAKRLLKILSR